MPQLTKVEATLCVLPVFLYCCFLRSLRKLLPVSFLANIAILIGYVLVMRVAIVDVAGRGPSPTALDNTVRTSSLPLFFGLVTSSYEGIGLILPVEGASRLPRGCAASCEPPTVHCRQPAARLQVRSRRGVSTSPCFCRWPLSL